MCEPKRVKRWGCPYCTFVRVTKCKGLLVHIKHCWKNPNREPFAGELSRHDESFEIVDYGPMGDEGPPGLNWLEPVEVETPKWWPGHGYIYTGDHWAEVPGYGLVPIGGAHGCAGGDPYMDEWPEVGDGKTLDQLRPIARLHWYRTPSRDAERIAADARPPAR